MVLRYLISFSLIALILGVLIRSVEFGELIEAFHHLRISCFALIALAHICIIFIISPLVWRFILRHLDCIVPLRTIFGIWIGMSCLRSVMPMKSGGVVGAYYLHRNMGLSFSRGVGSLLLLHFINFYTLWVYLAMGMFFTGIFGYLLPTALGIILIAVPFIIPWMSAFSRFAGWIHPRLGEIFGNLIGAFTDIPFRSRILLFAVVLLFQCVDLLIVGLGLFGAGIQVPVEELFLRVPLVYLVANLPLTLMGLGTREATMLFAFSAFGPPASILAASLGLSFCMEIVPVLLSSLYLPRAVSMGLFDFGKSPAGYKRDQERLQDRTHDNME